MNENSPNIKFNFSTVPLPEHQVPKFMETWNPTYNYYSVGVDNKWFLQLLELFYKSSVHASILNNLHYQIIKEDEANDFYMRVVLDYLIFGGFAVEVIWNTMHTGILKLNHIDYSKVRSGKPDDQNNPIFYYFSNDWFKYSNRKISMIQSYDENENFDNHQIFVYKRYIAGEDVYPKPYYFSGIEWIQTEIELQNYYTNLVLSNFEGNTLVNVPGYMDEDKIKDFEKKFREFTGSSGKHSFINYCEDKEHSIEIKTINDNEGDRRYRFLTEQVTTQIAISHSYPAPLLGLLVPGKLGNATDIPVFLNMYNNNIIQPMKREIDRALQTLYDKKISI